MPVVNHLKGSLPKTSALRESGIIPKLAVVRIGEREDDLA
jgi:hypothetical protein